MIFGKGKKIKSCYSEIYKNAIHMIDYSCYRKDIPICIETIGENDAKYYTVEQANIAWNYLLSIGYEEF